MIEPIPSATGSEFFSLRLLAVAYVLTAVVVTWVAVTLWLPLWTAVPTFLVVAGLLAPPFWWLVRRHYPE